MPKGLFKVTILQTKPISIPLPQTASPGAFPISVDGNSILSVLGFNFFHILGNSVGSAFKLLTESYHFPSPPMLPPGIRHYPLPGLLQ